MKKLMRTKVDPRQKMLKLTMFADSPNHDSQKMRTEQAFQVLRASPAILIYAGKNSLVSVLFYDVLRMGQCTVSQFKDSQFLQKILSSAR